MAYKGITADIGVFGGSGFYSFAEDIQDLLVETPYGAPSDRITIATVHDRRLAFLPRHGKGHTLPAHAVNYRANIWALHSLGVRQIIAPFACGSLRETVKRGDFVIVDQFVDRTSGREDTFFNGPETHHIGCAEPYCTRLRQVAIEAAKEQGIPVHETGTVVVIQGPRFSTRAESHWFARNGWDVVGMTQYPECVLARELGICYTGIALVTDYDAGLTIDTATFETADTTEVVTVEMVLETMAKNTERVKELIFAMAARLPETPGEDACPCAREAVAAIMNS